MEHLIGGVIILGCAALFLLAILHGILVVPLSICLGAGMVGILAGIRAGLLEKRNEKKEPKPKS